MRILKNPKPKKSSPPRLSSSASNIGLVERSIDKKPSPASEKPCKRRVKTAKKDVFVGSKYLKNQSLNNRVKMGDRKGSDEFLVIPDQVNEVEVWNESSFLQLEKVNAERSIKMAFVLDIVTDTYDQSPVRVEFKDSYHDRPVILPLVIFSSSKVGIIAPEPTINSKTDTETEYNRPRLLVDHTTGTDNDSVTDKFGREKNLIRDLAKLKGNDLWSSLDVYVRSKQKQGLGRHSTGSGLFRGRTWVPEGEFSSSFVKIFWAWVQSWFSAIVSINLI